MTIDIEALRNEWGREKQLRPAVLDPILPLSPGHLGLALASGMLDGRLTLANGKTVVVRGVSSKEEYDIEADANRENGLHGTKQTTTVTKRGEKAKLVIRVLDQDGNITEYQN